VKKVRNGKRKELPLWNVVLLNDDVNTKDKVIAAICHTIAYGVDRAEEKVKEAHQRGRSVLVTTHREKAELVAELFRYHSPPISIALEPA
jgi:ATP-dependent Clp protease adaptor protein ClpS